MRPWVLRAAVMAVLYGVGQAVFVAVRSWAPDSATVASAVLLVLLIAVGLLWGGIEVVTDRRPPEWTWFGAALASAPAAGLLTWILLAIFVDATGVADLGAAIIGRAAFTALLVLASAALGARLGWLSLRRRGEGADDPALDTDDAALASSVPPATTRSGPTARVPSSPAAPSVGGLRTPAPRPAAPKAEPVRRAEPARASRPDPASTPTGDLEPPVVAVLPSLPDLPERSAPAAPPADDEPAPRRRRSVGLRRPHS